MIKNYSTYDIAQHITNRIRDAVNILVVCSRPVDPDSLSSGITMSWWIEKHFKQSAEVVIFHSISEKFKDYPLIKQVKFKTISEINWKEYDLIILVDSSAWDMLLTEKYEDVLSETGFGPFVLIDHHLEDTIHKDLRHNALRLDDVCTGRIIDDYFIKPSTENLTEDIATLLYYGLIDDARYFRNEPYEGMYLYAEELLKQGARHNEVMNIIVDEASMKFLAWAINNTEFYPNIKTTFLIIDEKKDKELSKLFGDKWNYGSLQKYYQEVFMRITEGYTYGIMMEYKNSSEIVAGWRTRNFGQNLSIKDIFCDAGAKQAGGHFGAGGGLFKSTDIHDVKEKIIAAIDKSI
ncbi:hypothetical protein KC669_03240 [Candidatus Dojkabacteria bacterium]|uniref:DDH domain-containing protein n=1 Tax=Candidatus Dojkabacteria bacterium TaxID=2099670 RepID=A0A955LAF0_9BACT|nr:hypothetical protein [Candidatus Dojkabacteria bacterium]